MTKEELLRKNALIAKARAARVMAPHDEDGEESKREINDEAVRDVATTKRKKSTGNHGKGKKPARREYMVVDQSEIKQECEVSEQESDE